MRFKAACAAPLRAPRQAVQFALPLPVADAARPAGPDLNPRIERLGVERIAVPPRQFRSSQATRFLLAHTRNAGLMNNDPGLGLRFRARLRNLASAIGPGLDRNRHELCG